MACAMFMLMPLLIAPAIQLHPITPSWGMLSSVILLGYHSSSFRPLLPAWSLDIEMQFYLLAPFVLIGMKRKPVAVYAVLIGACAAIAMLYDPAPQAALAGYLPYFMMGMLAAKYPAVIHDKRYAIGSLVALSLLLGAFLLAPDLRPVLLGGAHPGSLYQYNEALNVAVALVSVPFVLSTVKNASGPFDKLMADLSYSVYLFHWIPDLIVLIYFPQLATKSHAIRTVSLCGILVLTYSVALLITLLVDRPANRARARFVRARTVNHPAKVSTIPAAADPA
jgi:peptidoglycan/LPS O-acetylase OafA/YrhL